MSNPSTPDPIARAASALAARPTYVEAVDNWSDRWPDALALLDTLHDRHILRLDDEGWLPARQTLLVAHTGARPVAFLAFTVQPVIKDGAIALSDSGKPLTEAVVDGEGALPDTDRPITRQLREAAMNRALELRCSKFRWEHPQPATC